MISISTRTNFVSLFIATLAITIFLGAMLFLKGLYIIPEKHEAVLLKANSFHKTIKPGFNFHFPLFRIYSLATDAEGEEILYPTAIKELSLLDIETVEEDKKGGDNKEVTEFDDGDAWLISQVTFQVVDTKKAFTNRQDFMSDMLKKLRELQNNYFSGKNLQLLLESPDNITIDDIDPGSIYRNKYLSDDGVRIIDYRLQETVLSDETSKIRRKILESSIAKKIAKNQKVVIDILAKADKKATEDTAKAWVYAVESLKTIGYTEGQANSLLQTHIKWNTLEKTEKMKWEAFEKTENPSLIIGSSDAMLGSAASAGYDKEKKE